MPLEILAPMVVLGIALAVILVHLSGISKPSRLADQDQVEKLLLLEYPEAKTKDVFIDANGQSALATYENGNIGTVEVMGSKFLTRQYGVGDVLSVNREDGAGVTAKFRDFTHPKQFFAGTSKQEIEKLESIFSSLTITSEKG